MYLCMYFCVCIYIYNCIYNYVYITDIVYIYIYIIHIIHIINIYIYVCVYFFTHRQGLCSSSLRVKCFFYMVMVDAMLCSDSSTYIYIYTYIEDR